MIIFFAAEDGEALYSQQKQDRELICGSDHELLIAKFRLKLKKAGKTTRPFRYDLNQIPYDYTVEVRNRFKGLDLIDRVPAEQWMEVHCIVQMVKVTQSCLTLCDAMNCLWNSPGENTELGSLSLLQEIFRIQGLNPDLPALQADSLQVEPKGKPYTGRTWVLSHFSHV